MEGRGKTQVFGSVIDIAQEGDELKPVVVLIRPGMSANRLKWTAPVLRKAVEEGIFDGVRMFRDHNKPNPINRSMNELVSAVESSRIGGPNEKDAKGRPLTDAVIGNVKFLDKGFAAFAQEAREYMGTSVVVQYIGERKRDREGPYVEPKRITNAISVDWVPFPAVPGTGLIDYAQESFTVEKWTDEDIEQLRRERPELFAGTSQEGQPGSVDVSAVAQEAAKQVASQIKTAMSEVVAEAVKTTQEQIAQESREKAETLRKIDDYLKGIALPTSTKSRIRAQFDGAREYNEDELKTACESARAEFDEYRKQAGITGPMITGGGVTGSAQEGEGDGGPAVPPYQHQALAALGGAFSGRTQGKKE